MGLPQCAESVWAIFAPLAQVDYVSAEVAEMLDRVYVREKLQGTGQTITDHRSKTVELTQVFRNVEIKVNDEEGLANFFVCNEPTCPPISLGQLFMASVAGPAFGLVNTIRVFVNKAAFVTPINKDVPIENHEQPYQNEEAKATLASAYKILQDSDLNLKIEPRRYQNIRWLDQDGCIIGDIWRIDLRELVMLVRDHTVPVCITDQYVESVVEGWLPFNIISPALVSPVQRSGWASVRLDDGRRAYLDVLVSFRGHFEYFSARVDLIEDERARHNNVDVIVFGRPLLDSLVQRDRLGEAWKTRTLPHVLPPCREIGVKMDPVFVKEEPQSGIKSDFIMTTVKTEVADVDIGANHTIDELMEVCPALNEATLVPDKSQTLKESQTTSATITSNNMMDIETCPDSETIPTTKVSQPRSTSLPPKHHPKRKRESHIQTRAAKRRKDLPPRVSAP